MLFFSLLQCKKKKKDKWYFSLPELTQQTGICGGIGTDFWEKVLPKHSFFLKCMHGRNLSLDLLNLALPWSYWLYWPEPLLFSVLTLVIFHWVFWFVFPPYQNQCLFCENFRVNLLLWLFLKINAKILGQFWLLSCVLDMIL